MRNNISLKQAALDLGIQLDPDEVDKIGRRKEFQEIQRIEANKFYAGVANDPTRTKSTTLGRMWVQAEQLNKNGELDKAAVVLEKIAKIEGWSGAESNVNIFADLTGRDLAEAKDRIKKQLESSGTKIAQA